MSIKKNYTIISDLPQYYEAVEHIKSHTYLAFDTETTGLNVRKDKVIGFSFCGKPGTAYYFPVKTWTNGELCKWYPMCNHTEELLNLLKEKELIMWNGSFDIRMVKNNFGIDLTGPLIADGMLMKHTCDEEKPFGLKAVAIKIQDKLGLDIEREANEEAIALKANVEKNGGSTKKTNYEMYKADLNIMGKYACSDADLTLRISEYYKSVLEKEDLLDFFFTEEVMPLYKCVTIPMEERGIKLDLELIEKTKVAIEKDIIKLEKKILRKLFEDDNVHQWYSERVEGFTNETPKGKYAQGVAAYYDLPLPKTPTGKYKISKKELTKLPDSDAKLFLLGDGTLDQGTQFTIKEKIYLEKNEKLNISSKKQMGEIVFGYMNIKPLSKTEKGAPQFNDDMISHLTNKEDMNWAKDLSNYNKLVKIKGAYVDRFLDNHEDGYYYFSYKQHGTISGRYSSDAQQLPRFKESGELDPIILGYSNIIRTFFVPRSGYKMIICDQSALEARVFSSVSGDPNLIKVFVDGDDLYSRIAIQAFGLSGVSANKADDNYLKKVYPELRQRSKVIALAIPYGAGDYQVSKLLDISIEEAGDLIKSYLDGFPKLKSWMQFSKKQAQDFGKVETKLGRIRHLPKVKAIYKIHKDKLLNMFYRSKMKKLHGHEYIMGLYRDYKNGINNARNSQIQGLSASIMNRSGIKIMETFQYKDAHLLFQLHDEYVFEVRDDYVKEACGVIRHHMENTVTLDTPLEAIPSVAANFGEGHD